MKYYWYKCCRVPSVQIYVYLSDAFIKLQNALSHCHFLLIYRARCTFALGIYIYLLQVYISAKGLYTVKPLITNTSEEFIKCRLSLYLLQVFISAVILYMCSRSLYLLQVSIHLLQVYLSAVGLIISAVDLHISIVGQYIYCRSIYLLQVSLSVVGL